MEPNKSTEQFASKYSDREVWGRHISPVDGVHPHQQDRAPAQDYDRSLVSNLTPHQLDCSLSSLVSNDNLPQACSVLPTATSWTISWTEPDNSSQHAARWEDPARPDTSYFPLQIDTIGMLLQDLEKYQDHSYTALLQDQVLDFVDGFGNNFLQLGAIVKISETMIKRILARQSLQADEFAKFQVFSWGETRLISKSSQAALMWCKTNSKGNSIIFRRKIKTFMDYIKFEYIPCDVIVKEIYPLKIVSHFIIIRALARQADPSFQDFPPVEFLISPSSPERKVRTDVKTLRSWISI